MSDIGPRLDQVRELLQNKDFLAGKGLSNEVNIRIFCYHPEDEMEVRHFSNKISSETKVSVYSIAFLRWKKKRGKHFC